MDSTDEIWKPVPSDPRYAASSLGRIRGPSGVIKGCKVLGYLVSYRTIAPRKQQAYKHHRFVAEAWHGIPATKMQVNHLNGVKHDNRPENLEWATARRNTRHASGMGVKYAQKLLPADIPEIRKRIAAGNSYEDIGADFGVHRATISSIARRKIWDYIP